MTMAPLIPTNTPIAFLYVMGSFISIDAKSIVNIGVHVHIKEASTGDVNDNPSKNES